MQWNYFALLVFASIGAKGVYDMSLKSLSVFFALHFCSVPRGTDRAHTSVSHSGHPMSDSLQRGRWASYGGGSNALWWDAPSPS